MKTEKHILAVIKKFNNEIDKVAGFSNGKPVNKAVVLAIIVTLTLALSFNIASYKELSTPIGVAGLVVVSLKILISPVVGYAIGRLVGMLLK